MAQMTMTLSMQQTGASSAISSHATMQGQDYDSKIHYDLTGKPATNEAPMSGASQTVSKWDGSKLVTTWTSPGAVAGSKLVRTETRSLSTDGQTLTPHTAPPPTPHLLLLFKP